MPKLSAQDNQFGINAISLLNSVCSMLNATTTSPTTPALLLASLTSVAGLKAAIAAIKGLDNTQRAIRDECVRAIEVCYQCRVPLAVPVAPSGANLTTATSGGALLDNTTYYFRITAIDDQGNESFPSPQVSKATGAAATADDNTITLKNMTHVNGAASYRLYPSLTTGVFTSGYVAVAKSDIEGSSGYVFTTMSGLVAATLPTTDAATKRFLSDEDVTAASSTDTLAAFVSVLTNQMPSPPPSTYTAGEQWV